MQIPKRLSDIGITEQEILRSNSNTYSPGFMQIYLKVHFNGVFKDMDEVHDQGSFLHEYIHYLQNLTTPWGLYTSMISYLQVVDTYAFIQASSEELKLPLKIDLVEDAKRKSEIIKTGNGQNPFEMITGSRVIDRNKKIVWHRRHRKINGKLYPYIIIDVPCVDGNKTIELGAYIIKESMAAMYQMQLDPTATHLDNDLPYNLVKILAEQNFSNIASDDKKLISICYLSLFSLSPAEVLFEQLTYANEHPNIDGIELLSNFVNDSIIMVNGKNTMKIVDFFEYIADKFEKALEKSLQIHLDYIHEAIHRIRLRNGFVPILTTLYNPNFGVDAVQNLIDYVGIPYIHTIFQEYHYPESVSKPNIASDDMIALIGQYAIYNYLVSPNDYKCCPLRYMCLSTTFEKEECFDAPWLGHECVMTVMGDVIGLKNKKIHW